MWQGCWPCWNLLESACTESILRGVICKNPEAVADTNLVFNVSLQMKDSYLILDEYVSIADEP